MAMTARSTPRALAQLSPVDQLRAGRIPRRLIQLFVGLTAYGISMALFVRANLGLDPWDVFHYGLTQHTPMNLGVATIVTSIPVLLLWIPLRQIPGLGTIANAIWIGIATNIGLATIPAPHGLLARSAVFVGALVLNGLAGGLYIGSQLGPGPRDGLMTGLHRRTGLSLRLVRTSIEVTVLVVGWLMGGIVGIGTLLYALCIGPLVQFFLQRCIVELPNRAGPGPETTGEAF